MTILDKIAEIEEALEDSYEAVEERGGTVPQKMGINNLPLAIGSINKGVPEGGTTGQILKKKTNSDYDTEWGEEQDISGKADKDLDAVQGNLAKFDSSGNPVDSEIGVVDVSQAISEISLLQEVVVDEYSEIDKISNKANKVVGATNGNIPKLTSDGNLADSGVSASLVEEVPDMVGVVNALKQVDLKEAPMPRFVSVPSTSSDDGEVGYIALDSDYLYVCIATDTWKRVALASF